MVHLVIGYPCQNLRCLIEFAQTDERAREAAETVNIVWRVADHLAVNSRSTFELFRKKQFTGLLQRVGQWIMPGGPRGLGKLVDECLHLAFRLGALESIHRLAAYKTVNCRH